MPSAYLLVSHGSRDPRPQLAMDRLARLISQRQSAKLDRVQTAGDTSSRQRRCQPSAGGSLAAPPILELMVGTACLELSPESLHEQIKKFADRVASGYNRLQVVPLFLLPGVHVMEDIPAQVAIAQQAIGQDITIEIRPYLGTHPGLSRLLATGVVATNEAVTILLAHGSRRAGSKPPVEALAKELGTEAAYWAVPPRLESRVKELVSAGYRQIGILPYFLFAGGITDAIAQSVEELKVQFPSTNFQLAEPLGASAALADLIWDLIEK